MPTIDIPSLGTAVLCAVLVAAGFAFATLRGQWPRSHAALTCRTQRDLRDLCLVALSVCLLAYSFQAHDFRMRYVLATATARCRGATW